LLIRPDHIGDLLFTTPALRALRAAFPQAYIAYLAGPWARAIVENNPHIDEVIVCECPGFTRRPKASFLEPYTLLLKYARRLRRRNFDLAINLRFDFWWGALLAYLAGIRRRVGYDIAECRPFLTEAVPHTKGKHEVEQNLTLIEAVTNGLRNMHDSNKALTDETICQVAGRQGTGGKGQVRLEFEPTGEEREFAAHYLFERGVEEGDKLICIHPGAGAPVKLWRREGFAQVADALAQRHGFRVILTGSEGERPLVQAKADGMREAPIVAAGDLALGQLAAVMERCSLVLGVDSGPLHLAVAMGTPTVHLYGPVDHRAFGPWGDPARHLVLLADLDCIPCNRLDYPPKELADHPCVRLISVEQVLAACEKLIGKKGAGVEVARVYLGLGSNLGDRVENIEKALRMLSERVRLTARSSLYETEPVGVRDQPWFLNVVCTGETDLDPQALLDFVKGIERAMGRVESVRFGPRIIDIDILFYDDLVLKTPNLEIPHPRLTERAFVLVPLVEIAPHLIHPLLGLTVREILEGVTGLEGVHRVQCSSCSG